MFKTYTLVNNMMILSNMDDTPTILLTLQRRTTLAPKQCFFFFPLIPHHHIFQMQSIQHCLCIDMPSTNLPPLSIILTCLVIGEKSNQSFSIWTSSKLTISTLLLLPLTPTHYVHPSQTLIHYHSIPGITSCHWIMKKPLRFFFHFSVTFFSIILQKKRKHG